MNDDQRVAIMEAGAGSLIAGGMDKDLAKKMVEDADCFAKECVARGKAPDSAEISARFDLQLAKHNEALESEDSVWDRVGEMAQEITGCSDEVLAKAMAEAKADDDDSRSEEEGYFDHMDSILNKMEEGGPMVAAGVVWFMENGDDFETAYEKAFDAVEEA